MALNKVLLIGNVGADPDVRYLDNNGKVANFRLATTERYKDRNGELKENTEWHALCVFGKPADFVENYVKKGAQLFVEGRLRTRLYTDKSGVEKSVTEIVVDNVQLLGSRQPNKDAVSQQKMQAAKEAPETPGSAPAVVDEPTDDLPF